MKLIIWWCSLMFALPFLYLFWQKKGGRLLFGIIILITVLFGYLAPGEIANSLIATEIEKEKPSQRLQENLRNISSDEINSSDSDKVKHEKLILRCQKELYKLEVNRGKEDKKKNFNDGLKEYSKAYIENEKLQKEWVTKGGKKSNQTLLFCGEEFNEELVRENKSGGNKLREVEDHNIIDFGVSDNNKIETFQEKLKIICQQNKREFGNFKIDFPIIGLKNIDKVTDSEVKNKILAVVDFEKNSDLGKYQQEIKIGEETKQIEKNINFSQFNLIVTTSSTNSRLSPELSNKLKKIESPLDKYFWGFFVFSLGIEIIVFYVIIRSNKKNNHSHLLFS